MKLDIKHIAPYLPYGVNCRYKYLSSDKYTKAKLTGVTLREVETTYKRKRRGCVGDLIGFEGNNNIQDLKFKLELRPLSSLTKEIEHNGEKFVPIEKLKELYNKTVDDNIHTIEYHNIHGFTIFGLMTHDSYEIGMPLWIYETLFSWHFDVFGLIEQGLAIDLNTVKN